MRKCPVCDKNDIPDDAKYCPNPDCLWEFEVWLGATDEDKQIYRKRVKVARRNYQAAQAINNGAGSKVSGFKIDGQTQVEKDKSGKQNEYSVETEVPKLKRLAFEYEEEFIKRINAYPPILVGEGKFNEDYDINTGIYPVKVSLFDWSKNLLGKVTKYSIKVDREDALALFRGKGPYPLYALLETNGVQALIKKLELYGFDKTFSLHQVEQEEGEDKQEQKQKFINKKADKIGKKSKQYTVWKEPVTGMIFVYVPGGKFEMGDKLGFDDEKPVHTVELDDFWIGKFQVTQEQWIKVMKNNPSFFKNGKNFPIECVSWLDCQEYISKLNLLSNNIFRLPTEAEWEYAARSAGKKDLYSGGNNVDDVAWHNADSDNHTHEVGTKRGNSLNIYDMSGNVYELCEDIYSINAYKKHRLKNPLYNENNFLSSLFRKIYRVERGGSWKSSCKSVRCTDRYYVKHDALEYDLGFRLVRVQ